MPNEPKPFSRIAEGLIGDFRGVPNTDPRRMRRRPTRELAAVVEELMVKHQIGRDSPEHTLREHWAELVGGANAAYSHAIRIDYGRRLVVQATHAVVRNELFLHRAEIIGRIQKLSGCAGVTELHIRAG